MLSGGDGGEDHFTLFNIDEMDHKSEFIKRGVVADSFSGLLECDIQSIHAGCLG